MITGCFATILSRMFQFMLIELLIKMRNIIFVQLHYTKPQSNKVTASGVARCHTPQNQKAAPAWGGQKVAHPFQAGNSHPLKRSQLPVRLRKYPSRTLLFLNGLFWNDCSVLYRVFCKIPTVLDFYKTVTYQFQ